MVGRARCGAERPRGRRRRGGAGTEGGEGGANKRRRRRLLRQMEYELARELPPPTEKSSNRPRQRRACTPRQPRTRPRPLRLRLDAPACVGFGATTRRATIQRRRAEHAECDAQPRAVLARSPRRVREPAPSASTSASQNARQLSSTRRDGCARYDAFAGLSRAPRRTPPRARVLAHLEELLGRAAYKTRRRRTELGGERRRRSPTRGQDRQFECPAKAARRSARASSPTRERKQNRRATAASAFLASAARSSSAPTSAARAARAPAFPRRAPPRVCAPRELEPRHCRSSADIFAMAAEARGGRGAPPRRAFRRLGGVRGGNHAGRPGGAARGGRVKPHCRETSQASTRSSSDSNPPRPMARSCSARGRPARASRASPRAGGRRASRESSFASSWVVARCPPESGRLSPQAPPRAPARRRRFRRRPAEHLLRGAAHARLTPPPPADEARSAAGPRGPPPRNPRARLRNRRRRAHARSDMRGRTSTAFVGGGGPARQGDPPPHHRRVEAGAHRAARAWSPRARVRRGDGGRASAS